MLRILYLILFLQIASAAPLQAQANDELINTVIGFLGDSDNEIRAIALDQIRSDVPGAEATEKFANLLPTLDNDAQVGLILRIRRSGRRRSKAGYHRTADVWQ